MFPQRLVGRVVGKTAHKELGPHRVFLIGVIVVVVVVAARVGGCGGHMGNNCGLWNKVKKSNVFPRIQLLSSPITYCTPFILVLS